MELPSELIVKFLEDWCICHFKDTKHAPEAPPHFYVIIPLQDSNLIISIITSQVEKKKKYYEKVNKKALNGLVFLKRGELSFLKREMSVVDCNQAEFLSKTELINRINSRFKIKIIERNLSEELKQDFPLFKENFIN